MRKVLVLGGGVGGVTVSIALAKDFHVTLVSRGDFTYYPGIPRYFMEGDLSQVVYPLSRLEARGVRVIRDEVRRIDLGNRRVSTAAGDHDYDYLIIALGAEVPRGPHLWSLEGAEEFRTRASGFRGGSLIVGVEPGPYRCPPAPFDVAYRLKKFFETRGVRVDVTVFHYDKEPLAGLGRHVYDALVRGLESAGIKLVSGFVLTEVDFDKGILRSQSGDELRFDLLHLVPRHEPPRPVAECDAADPKSGWLRIRRDFRVEGYDDAYAVGDVVAPTLGLPMAGFLAHYEAMMVASSIMGREGLGKAEAICPIEMGQYSVIPHCDFTPRLEGKSPICQLIQSSPEFMGLFRELLRDRFTKALA